MLVAHPLPSVAQQAPAHAASRLTRKLVPFFRDVLDKIVKPTITCANCRTACAQENGFMDDKVLQICTSPSDALKECACLVPAAGGGISQWVANAAQTPTAQPGFLVAVCVVVLSLLVLR